MIYIATFFSHFGAIRFQKLCQGRDWEAVLMPVPRNLSSSCGTCVRYRSQSPCPGDTWPREVEQVVQETPEGYRRCYRAENS